jgi:hypothetical protein
MVTAERSAHYTDLMAKDDFGFSWSRNGKKAKSSCPTS